LILRVLNPMRPQVVTMSNHTVSTAARRMM
jgi:hypothetical protein